MYSSLTALTIEDKGEAESPNMETDADLNHSERWIDAHSVTCALCGYLADERETINLYEQDIDLEGEAHQDCWENSNRDDIAKERDDG